MQNQQMAQMAQMAASNGPVDGTPIMGNKAIPQRNQESAEKLNTYIYDYFVRNKHYALARLMVEQNDIKLNLNSPQKPAPNRANGVDEGADLPEPGVPPNQPADNSFLLDWWTQFWDIFQASKRGKNGPQQGQGAQYIQHTRVSRTVSHGYPRC
jgi:hypothetical protein